MNKKLKKILATVSAVAMCATSVASMSAGAIAVFKDRVVKPETTSFSASIYGKDVKMHLWQEATNYIDDEDEKIYISDTLVNDFGEEYTYKLASTHVHYYDTIAEKWIDYCSVGLLGSDWFEFNNNKDMVNFQKYLSDNNIAYEIMDYDENTLHIEGYKTDNEHFEILQKIKEDTGLMPIWLCPASTIQITDAETPLPEPTLTGDATEDGEVNIADAVLIMQSLSNPNEYKLTPQGMANADMDGDGVTALDALTIQQMLLDK